MKSFILSSSGLKNIVQNRTNEEFKFIFGEHEIKMNSIFAEFLSPYVSQIHYSDPTINSVHFTDKIDSHFFKQINDDTFSLLKSLAIGNAIDITKDQCIQLQIISMLLQNEELYSKLSELFSSNIEIDNIDKLIEYIPLFERNSQKFIFHFNTAIENVSSQLYSIDENKILELPATIFYSILKNEKLTIESEDQLFELIEKFQQKNQDETEFFNFYEEIEFQFLSENNFKEFIENFNQTEITGNLWSKLKKCFYIYNISPSKLTSSHHYRHKIEYDEKSDSAFKGIIHRLTDEFGGNVDEKGVVKVTSSSYNKDRYQKYAVDLDDNCHYFQSSDDENAWLQYDFLNRKVKPSHYSIRTRHDQGKGSNHPRNWAIKGSNDGMEWTTLDSRANVDFLNDSNCVHTFEIKNRNNRNEGYRYLRLCQTGLDGKGYHYLTLSALEYFGDLIEN